MAPVHIPVLSGEITDLLNLKPGSIVVDATLGLGGHSKIMAKKIGSCGVIIGIDKDVESIKIVSKNLCIKKPNSQLIVVHGSYVDIDTIVANYGYKAVDAILFDLGLSSLQLDTATRGFSFQKNAPLDMRFDTTEPTTAADIVNGYPVKKLADLIWRFGQERQSRKIAKAIFDRRRQKRIETTDDLAQIISKAKGGRRGKIHPATLTFQALRIVVNQELLAIQTALPKAIKLLKSKGRLAVISYHSLEDRLVKHLFRDFAQNDQIALVVKKPIIASKEEIKNNPRARSAKLRVIEKI